jgi:hypothetical protein
MKTLTFLNIIFTLNACAQQSDTANTWQSKTRDLQFQYNNAWTLVPVSDDSTQLFVGVIDTRDGKSYIIQVFDDLPQEKLSNELYLTDTRNKMLKPNPKNKVIIEDSISFHGQIAYRQVFLMYTDKWGLLRQISHVIRTGKELITIQISYPTTESEATNETIPGQLIALDKSVKLNGK